MGRAPASIVYKPVKSLSTVCACVCSRSTSAVHLFTVLLKHQYFVNCLLTQHIHAMLAFFSLEVVLKLLGIKVQRR